MAKYRELTKKDQKNKQLISLLREFDINVNVNWKLAHYKSAIKHLKNKNKFISATGGTNWQSYLPPKFKKLFSFLIYGQIKKRWSGAKPGSNQALNK